MLPNSQPLAMRELRRLFLLAKIKFKQEPDTLTCFQSSHLPGFSFRFVGDRVLVTPIPMRSVNFEFTVRHGIDVIQKLWVQRFVSDQQFKSLTNLHYELDSLPVRLPGSEKVPHAAAH